LLGAILPVVIAFRKGQVIYLAMINVGADMKWEGKATEDGISFGCEQTSVNEHKVAIR